MRAWQEPALILDHHGKLIAFNDRARQFNSRLKKGDRLESVLPEQVMLDKTIRYGEPFIYNDAGAWGSLSHTRITIMRMPWLMGSRMWLRIVDDSRHYKERAALSRQLSLHEAVFDSIPLILLLKDEKGRYVRLNKAGRNYLGCPPVTGKETDAHFFSPDVVERHRQWESRIQLTNIPIQRHEIDEKADHISSIDLYITPVIRELDNARFFLYLAQDDTRRLSQELSLQQWLKRLMALIDSLPQYILFRDQVEQTLTVNRNAQRLFELPSQVVSIPAVQNMLTPASRQLLQQHIDEVIAKKAVCETQGELEFIDGRMISLNGKIIPLFHHRTGKLDGVLTIYDTMSEAGELKQSINLTMQRIEALVQTDQLTGVANNEYVHQYFEAQWQLLAKNEEDLVLLSCEVDHFDSYQDYQGSLAAERAQTQVAQCLRSCLERPRDLIGRSGEGQFMIILPGCSREGVNLVIQRCQQAMKRHPIRYDQSPVATYLTLSIGGIWCQPDATATQRVSCEQQANKALTVAQLRGGNQAVIVPEEENNSAQD